MKVLLYRASTPNYDNYRPIPDLVRKSCDFVEGERETKILVKEIKVNPLSIYPHTAYYDFTMWIDSSIEILFNKSLPQFIHKYLGRADLCFFQHPHRSCAYDEAKICVETGVADREKTEAQIERYRAEGFPEHYGLFEAGVLIRRNSPRVNRFNDAWWWEIRRGSIRDQISLPYVLWKHRKTDYITWNLIPGHLSTNENEYFKVHKHAGQ